MYKLLLCWRYLRTRYIALVCIVSVMLGVATMIVVNSVMAGFSRDLEGQMNGILGDIIVRVRSMDGVPDAEKYIADIKKIGRGSVIGASPSVQVPALLYLGSHEQLISQQVMLVGIDESTYGSVSAFGKFLQHPTNREKLSFELRENGYDTQDYTEKDKEEAWMRPQMSRAGWVQRRIEAAKKRQRNFVASAATNSEVPVNPFGTPNQASEGHEFDMAVDQHVGIVLGISICDFNYADKVRGFHAVPGDDVRVSFPKATLPPEAINEFYTVVDFYESKYAEYDSSLAFVPLRELQRSRGMIDPETGIGRFTAIQVKLAPGTDINAFRDKLRESPLFPVQFFQINTWRDEQGALLSAIWLETTILNILLFLIVAVAGFGILAIFCMIVVEKTRDIGILKSLGASWWGIMGIFLGYGLLLGLVGAGIGTYLGLKIVEHIQDIADLISRFTGIDVCDPSIYMFNKIPTVVEPFTVSWVCAGAVLIAVFSSILPAIRAANLHPVRALRYE